MLNCTQPQELTNVEKNFCDNYSTLQVATILVAMAPKILELATWFVKKSP